jgi:hypothetical protein
MIHTEPIEALVTIALHTVFIRDEKPQSLMIISEIENGKTKLLTQFDKNEFIAFPHDATAFGIVRDYLPLLQQHKLKFLVFPEFIQPLSRNRDTVKTFVAFLNGLTEDGIKDLSTYAADIHLKERVYAGVIVALATDEFNQRKQSWAFSGFLSRFLPITYSYSEKSAKDIFEGIYHGKLEVNDFKIDCKETDVILPAEIAKKLNPFAKDITHNIISKTLTTHSPRLNIKGYRTQLQLQRMVKGLALVNGRTIVTEEDLSEFIELLKYVNLDYNEL